MPRIDKLVTNALDGIPDSEVTVIGTPHVVVDTMPSISVSASISGVQQVTTPPGQPLPVSGVVSLAGFGAGTLDVRVTDVTTTAAMPVNTLPGQPLPVSGVVSLAGAGGAPMDVNITGQPISVDTELVAFEPLPVSGVIINTVKVEITGQPIQVDTELVAFETLPVSGVILNTVDTNITNATLAVVTPAGAPLPVSGVVSLAGSSGGVLDVNLASSTAGYTVPVSGVVSIAGAGSGALDVNVTNTSLTIASGTNVNVAGGLVQTQTYKQPYTFTLFDSINLSTSARSNVIDKSGYAGISADVLITTASSLTGTMSIDICNTGTTVSPNWVPITLADGSTVVTVTGNQSINFDIGPLYTRYASLNWTRFTGSGTCTAVGHLDGAY